MSAHPYPGGCSRCGGPYHGWPCTTDLEPVVREMEQQLADARTRIEAAIAERDRLLRHHDLHHDEARRDALALADARARIEAARDEAKRIVGQVTPGCEAHRHWESVLMTWEKALDLLNPPEAT